MAIDLAELQEFTHLKMAEMSGHLGWFRLLTIMPVKSH